MLLEYRRAGEKHFFSTGRRWAWMLNKRLVKWILLNGNSWVYDIRYWFSNESVSDNFTRWWIGEQMSQGICAYSVWPLITDEQIELDGKLRFIIFYTWWRNRKLYSSKIPIEKFFIAFYVEAKNKGTSIRINFWTIRSRTIAKRSRVIRKWHLVYDKVHKAWFIIAG